MFAEEAAMRMTATTPQVTHGSGLPRGWIILGLTLVSWLVVAGAWVGLSQLFGFVAAAL
tara:strand:- start:1497 stop:1673 length:177 start_codon:yes stop_codon:yes gene_type:complete